MTDCPTSLFVSEIPPDSIQIESDPSDHQEADEHLASDRGDHRRPEQQIRHDPNDSDGPLTKVISRHSESGRERFPSKNVVHDSEFSDSSNYKQEGMPNISIEECWVVDLGEILGDGEVESCATNGV